MGKVIGGAIVGYIVMFAAVFLMLTVAWTVLGAGGAFQPGSWETSTVWVAVSLVVDVLAALAGGYVAVLIAKRQLGAQVLAGLVLVLGVAMAIPMVTTAPAAAGPRPDVVTMMDAMGKARQPTWLIVGLPFVGALFALLGGKLRKGGATPV